MKQKLEENRGITIISLVVTIIVLIILAGITINMVVGKNNIINTTKNEQYNAERRIIVEQLRMELLDKQKEVLETLDNEQISKVLEKHGKVNYTEDGDIEGIIVNEKFDIKLSEIWDNKEIKLSIEIEAEAYEGVYDGQVHDAITNLKVKPSDAKIEYALEKGKYSAVIPQVTNVNTYTVFIRASKEGYTTKEISKTVKIEKSTKATVTYADKLYNEAEQIGVTGDNVTITGTAKATNVGTYTAYATPSANYAWSDGTIETKTLTWKINQSVAKIGTTYYETLKNAINAVPDSTATTITLIANTTESDISVATTKNINLNLNSKTITGNIINSGTLIVGEGNISGKTPLNNSGTLTINSGNYTATTTNVCVLNYGTLTFKGGTISLPFSCEATALYNNGGTLNMTGGTITSNGYGLVMHSGSGIVINGKIEGKTGRWALLVRNQGACKTSNSIITGTNAVCNELNYANCVILSRAANYGITGVITGKVTASTNVSSGQAEENITLYNTGYTQLTWPTWTINNGQDDITWDVTTSSTGTHTYTVRKSAHGNQTGRYAVHIYSYEDGVPKTAIFGTELNF